MTQNAPAFGVPPTLRELLCGAVPYGGTAHSDVHASLGYSFPNLIVDDARGLHEDAGGSWAIVELLRGLYISTARMLTKRDDLTRLDHRIFQTRLLVAWTELGRLLDGRPGEDIELDWNYGTSSPLDDLRDRMTILMAMLGEQTALRMLPAILWRYARRAKPDEGMLELYCAAFGAEIEEGSHGPRTLPNTRLLDVLGHWRVAGEACMAEVALLARGRIRDAVGEAMLAQREAVAPAPKPVSRLAQIHAEEPAPEPEGPGLVVVASVAHLPGSVKDGESKSTASSSPRAEFAPIAGKRLPLVPVPDLARVQRVLASEFPDATQIIASILAPVAGRPYVRLPRLLLRGGPGTGTSRLARRLGEELGLDVTVYGCASVSDGSVIGTSRMWGTGRASVPLQAIKRAGAASVLIVLDEISRAGTRADNGRLTDGVLALVEQETARAYHDPYLECAVDLSAVSYVATANDTSALDPALLSRFRVVDMPAPTLASLPVLARSLVAELRRERGLDDRWLPDLTPDELDMIGQHWRGGSVRTLQALVECALDGRHAGPAN